MARLATLTGDPLAAYLVGRQLFQHERFDDALAALDLTVIARADDARVLAEARRMIAIARYRRGDREGARAMFEALAGDAERPQGLRDVAADWLDRIAREARPAQ